MWLEDWLARYPGTLLVITHDRDFIDRVADQILLLTPPRAMLAQAEALPPATTPRSEEQRDRAFQLQQSAFEKQQRTIKHLGILSITRFRQKATKAAQAQSRIKAP